MSQRKLAGLWFLGVIAVALLSFATAAQAGGTLRIAMTASDVPTTTGAPDNGFEGMRFSATRYTRGWCCGICRAPTSWP